MSNEIEFITISKINHEIDRIYNDLENRYYWTDNFTPELYILLAIKGFISTSVNYKGIGDILLPEIQEAYAVLDFKNLHISKKTNKLYNKNYKLEQKLDLDTFIPLLKLYHGDECWFTDSYISLLYKLKEYTLAKDNFQISTILLYHGDVITSGEVGYYIGKTFTSLTGFYNKEFNNWGTFQLVLLARELESKGIEFWNLGHPYMEYKKKLGAKILSRKEFLKRWV
ncbi:MAG: hypothetical protein OCD02_10720 [Spirochaetaceae bacterium]